MIIYEGLKRDFLTSCENDFIAMEIEENILTKLGKHTSKSEFRSWENSLTKVLNDKTIPADAGIAIEYNIPQTSKRIDFMISGYGKDGEARMVIIELKQWEEITEIKGLDAIVETYIGGRNRYHVHPSYQVWSYAQLLCDYNQTVQDKKIGLFPCACLHNYIRHKPDPIDAEQYSIYIEEAPVYTKGQLSELRGFIKKVIYKGIKKKFCI